MPRRLPFPHRWSEAGATALEYGIALPALLFLTFGAMDVGRLMWTYTTLHRAVEASARCAAINPVACGTPAQIALKASTEAWGLTVTPAMFTLQLQSCGARVTGTYNFSPLIPLVGQDGHGGLPSGITLSVSACYPT